MPSKKPSQTPAQYKTIASTCEWALSQGYHMVAFTDGASRKKGNLGGWGYHIVNTKDPSLYKQITGGEVDTTSQRMELTAISELVKSIQGMMYNVLVLSDSSYCVKGINEWRHKWKKDDWMTIAKWKSKDMEPVKNLDLWQPLDHMLFCYEGKLTFEWVKGHDDCEGNNLADSLATIAVEEVKKEWILNNPLAVA